MPLHPPPSRPPTIDPAAAARWSRIAPAESPWLHEEVGRRMDERLAVVLRTPPAWTHWCAVRGGVETHRRVVARYPEALCRIHEDTPAQAEAARRLFGQPPARSLWRKLVGGDAASPPAEIGETPDGSAGMLLANMGLHQTAEPEALIARWYRALAVDGFLMFSCFGPDTLVELRSLYARMGWPTPSSAFTDMHDFGDMLVHAGFAEPVMDMERIVLTWGSAAALIDELRGLGRNLHPARFPALRGRGFRRQLEDALTAQLADPADGGRLRLTFEIVHGHAFKGTPKVKVAGESSVSLGDMRTLLGGGRSRPPR